MRGTQLRTRFPLSQFPTDGMFSFQEGKLHAFHEENSLHEMNFFFLSFSRERQTIKKQLFTNKRNRKTLTHILLLS